MFPHYITPTNQSEAAHAARMILNLYKEAVTLNGGLGQNQFAKEFDAFKFLQCRIDAPFRNQIKLDIGLLQEGAAVSLLCRLFDASAASESGEVHQRGLVKKIKQFLNEGAFDALPLAKDAACYAFEDRDIFSAKLQLVYEEYVLGYFYKILSAHSKISNNQQISYAMQ